MKYILTIFFLLSACIANCQEFNAGFSLGISASQLDGDNLSGYNKLGIRTGAIVERKIGRRTDWWFGILYQTKGARKYYRQTNNANNLQNGPFRKLTLHYIDVPIGINYQQSNKVNLLVALAYSYLVSSSIVQEPGTVANFTFSNSEFSLLFGFEVPLNEYIGANMNFQYSIISTVPGQIRLPNFDIATRIGQFNNTININLTYYLGQHFDEVNKPSTK